MKSHTILIIDDSPDSIEILRNILNKNYKVQAALNGPTALQLLSKQNTPDLILLDVLMPEMDGFEVCSILKTNEITVDIPIIFISALQDVDAKVKGLTLGGVDFISKPFNTDEVLARVNTHLRLKEIRQQLESEVEDKTQELARVNTQKALLLESIVEGVLGLDLNGLITFTNPAAYTLLGYSDDALIGKSIETLFDVKYDENIQVPDQETNFLSSMIGDKAKKHISQLIYRQDGSSFPTELNCAPVQEGKQITGFVTSFIDISERKKIERMQNEFISMVSHELRTPLTAINGSLGLITGGVVGDVSTDVTDLVNRAQFNCDRLEKLINDLLEINSLTSGTLLLKLQIIGINELVNRAITMLDCDAKKCDVEIRNEINTNASIECDIPHMTQVFYNVLSNAIKFSPKNSTVRLTCEETTDSIKLLISDKGCGIPEAFKEKVFLRFSQADSSNVRKKGGTGLGLAIAKEILDQHNGQISFESEEGLGTTFSIELPLATA